MAKSKDNDMGFYDHYPNELTCSGNPYYIDSSSDRSEPEINRGLEGDQSRPGVLAEEPAE